ncbi:MAG: DMT family transporter [Alphaproteobacteria bacterium]|nr:DMT family transporter [Alphaproteobacteria bacterium]
MATVGSARISNNAGGIYCIVIGMAVITAQDSAVKWLSTDYALHQIMLTRAVIGLCVALAILRIEGGLYLLRTRHPVWHMVRGLLLIIANLAFFLAVAAMPLAEAVAIFFVAPLVITGLSVPVLGEQVGIRRWAAVFVGLVGVIVMTRPGAELFNWTALLPIVAAVSYASLQMITRRLGTTDSAGSMTFHMQSMMIIVSLAIGISVGDGRFAGSGNPSLEFLLRAWVLPETGDLWLFAWCGVASGIGGYFLTQAYRLGTAAAVSSFEYVALPMSMAWGFAFWGDWPDSTAFAGMALILGAGIYTLHREHLHRQRSIDRPQAAARLRGRVP